MYYSEMTLNEKLFLGTEFMGNIQPKCEYRSPQFDGGTQSGRMIQCSDKAVMWTDRGLRCEMHRRD